MAQAPSIRQALENVLNSEQGVALRKREKGVDEKYKGGRRSVVEDDPPRGKARPSLGIVNTGGNQTSVSEDIYGARAAKRSQDLGYDRRKNSRIGEFLAAQRNSKSTAVENFEIMNDVPLVIGEDAYSLSSDSDEESVLSVASDSSIEFEDVYGQTSEAKSNKETAFNQDINQTTNTPRNQMDVDEKEDGVPIPVRPRSSTKARTSETREQKNEPIRATTTVRSKGSLGATLKRVGNYVSALSKGGYAMRKYYEEQRSDIASSNQDEFERNVHNTDYYFTKNPLGL